MPLTPDNVSARIGVILPFIDSKNHPLKKSPPTALWHFPAFSDPLFVEQTGVNSQRVIPLQGQDIQSGNVDWTRAYIFEPSIFEPKRGNPFHADITQSQAVQLQEEVPYYPPSR